MGGDTRGIFLFELKYVMSFRNTGFNSFIHSFSYIFFNLFIFHTFRVLLILCSGF